jgi:hypothetical protein
MPQPYRPKAPLTITPAAPLLRPTLAARMAYIASLSASLDVELGTLLALLLGTSAEIGISMYTALTSTATRKAILDVAIEITLTDNAQKEFEKVYKIIKGAQGQRNTVLHGVWTLANDRPDALIFVDPVDSVQTFAKNWAEQLSGKQAGLLSGAPFKHEPQYLAYIESDFMEIETALHAAGHALLEFWIALPLKFRPQSPQPGPFGWATQSPPGTTI